MMPGPSGSNTSAMDEAGFTDPLTGLGNHRRFVDKIARLQAERSDDPAPFTIGIIDLDGFKPINDLFGRAAGDEILSQVGLRLRASMDKDSIVTRLGAEEICRAAADDVFTPAGAASRKPTHRNPCSAV